MATPIVMPNAGNSVESCIISKWNKKKGDNVKKGDILFEYETDKATFEEESTVDGILLEIFFEENDDVPVLTNVCVIGEEGEDIKEFRPNNNKELNEAIKIVGEEKEKSDNTMSKKEEPKQIDLPIYNSDDIKISPRAKNKAKKLGVDYRYANPSGPNGRIIEKDIYNLYQDGQIVNPAAKKDYYGNDNLKEISGSGIGGRISINDLHSNTITSNKNINEYEDVKLSNIRKVIAKSMYESLSNSAQLTLNTSFDASNILAYRKMIKENRELIGLENITINDIILYAVSKTLLNHKELNAHFLNDKIRLFNNVNLGVAVDTERGLMVPTIFNANKKSLNDISKEVADLASKCSQGNINPDYLKGASFTVSNLGIFGVEYFTPIINPPQTGILGVGTITKKCKESKNGELQLYPSMGLSLTFDHRALDGAPAARFLKELVNYLENFTIILAK